MVYSLTIRSKSPEIYSQRDPLPVNSEQTSTEFREIYISSNRKMRPELSGWHLGGGGRLSKWQNLLPKLFFPLVDKQIWRERKPEMSAYFKAECFTQYIFH